MRRIMIVVAAAVLLGAGMQARAQDIATATLPRAALPRAPWLQEDPADSLYRVARAALSQSRFRDAVGHFRTIREKYPRSGYTPDALYWEAFALHRLGGNANLRAALTALQMQAERFPRAATRGDGESLTARINSDLARLGDARSAMAVTRAAEAAAAPPARPATPMPASSARAPRPPRDARGPRGRDECAGEDDTKAIALNALIQMDSERALPILKKLLARRDTASVCLRRRAIFLVAQHETSETEDLLLAAARNDPDSEVREQAVFWLSQVDSDRAVSALDSILRMSRDEGLQEKAIFALSQQRSPRAATILRTYAERNDVPDELRVRAIFWIGQSNDAGSADFMRQLYGRLTSEELKGKVLFSIAQSSDPANTRWLLDLAKNGREPIEARKQALFWVGQGSASIDELVSLYDQMTDREMREQLVFVYSQRDEPAALDKMLDIARRDADAEIRKRALFWIGQSDDPRATQIIQDILED